MQFRSLIDGLKYQTKCPLCQARMTIDERDYLERLEYPLGHEYQRFAFPLSRQSEDILYVYTASERVELILGGYQDKIVYGNSVGKYSNTIPISEVYNGRILQSVNVACDACCRYKYTLKLDADLNAGCLGGTYLNSEMVSIDEGGKTYEIRNVYSFDKTEYAVFASNQDKHSGKSAELPLIPLDLKNPKETLARIQKLLIFS